jgi:hypothetical protein
MLDEEEYAGIANRNEIKDLRIIHNKLRKWSCKNALEYSTLFF